MENIPLLKDLIILMVAAVPITFFFHRLGLPTIVGFLITGVVIGPFGFGIITDHHSIEVLAEIGVVLLLFTIGLEFSISKLLKIRREALIGGGLQVGFTTLLVLIIERFLGQPLPVALLLGFIISLSSSAIVLKLLVDKGEVNSSFGNLSVGLLLFQDICIVLMVLIIQGFGGEGGASFFIIAKSLLMAITAIVVIVVAASYIVPKFLYQIVRLESRELFILTILLLCMGTAWLTSLFGLSLALGAFIAGIVISESEYSHQIVAEILPFRDTFQSLFFISIGMLLEFFYFMHNLPLLIGMSLAILIIKALIITGVGMVVRYPLRLSIMVGISLAQIGEFSFVLIKMGNDYGMLTSAAYQTLLASSILTMAMTPFLFAKSSAIAFQVGKIFRLKGEAPHIEQRTTMANHVIIVGFGLNGQNLARVLKETGILYIVLDMHADKVRTARKEGHKVRFGDCSHPDVLKGLGVEKARMVVFTIPDPIATRRGVVATKGFNKQASILVRTRYLKEVEELYKLGATQVIPEEFETSVEIFSRVLHDYKLPANIIQNQIDIIRHEGYAMFRDPSIAREKVAELTSMLVASVTDTFYVEEGASIIGMTFVKLDLRNMSGATIIAVVRNGKAQTNPPADFKISAGDVLILLGSHEEMHKAFDILHYICPI
ncbi:MAG: potassium transporter KefB [Deltaproteobacteria bacterium]|nr:potassium transporter KefB [Deltaproteobacteria bacterium]